MKLGTKGMLAMLFIGACANSYLKNYKEAFNLTTTMLLVLIVWYNEREK